MRDWLKRLLCRIGWHSFGYDDVTGCDGFNARKRCRWCRGVGLVDSQGNLFSVRKESP